MDRFKRPHEGHCTNLGDSAKPSQPRWRKQLPKLASLNAPLLAIGAGREGKAPADPTTGYALSGWQHASHSVAEIQGAHSDVIAAGVRTGDRLIVFDIDGDSAWELVLQAYGCDPETTITWQIHRTTSSYRIKVAFRLTAEQAAQLGSIRTSVKTRPAKYADDSCAGWIVNNRHIPPGTGELVKKGEALEIFHSPSTQIVAIGKHPSSGGRYFWPKGMDPEALAPIPEGWWAMALDIAGKGHVWRQSSFLAELNGDKKNSHAREGGSSGSSRNWQSLSDCPICGRNTTSYCSRHKDGKTIRCFHGSTFSPPTGLKRGETFTDRQGEIWAFSQEQQQANGDVFSVFVRHDPNKRPKPSTEIKRFGSKPSAAAPAPGRRADHVIEGQYIGKELELPSAETTPLLAVRAPMGSGKTQFIAAGIQPRITAHVPTLLPTHRIALGKALCKTLHTEWAPLKSDPWRGLGGGMCFDSMCPTSGLQIQGDSWTGGTIVLDEWMQALEHLLFSSGTKLADRRAAVLRTTSELFNRAGQIVAADAQLTEWGIQLLEIITGHKATFVRSDYKPMAGRELHHHTGQAIKPTAEAFRSKWDELVSSGATLFCWTSAQQDSSRNSPQTLAALHRRRQPDHRVAVIDSSTPERAAELAKDPDAFAAQYDAIYASPTISSGVSFSSWQPDAVLVFSGGHIGPEHVAQACARVRSPKVPAYVFCPDRSPGNGLRVGSGHQQANELIKALRHVTDPLFGQLNDAGSEWLDAWALFGATRNRQRHNYGSTVIQLLKNEGWTEATQSLPPAFGDKKQRAAEFTMHVSAAEQAQVARLVTAEPITPLEARDIEKTPKPQRSKEEQASLDQYKFCKRWALPSMAEQAQQLIERGVSEKDVDEVLFHQIKTIRERESEGTRSQLMLGWLITDPDGLALLPSHDSYKLKKLDLLELQPFSPDRLRVTYAPKVAVLRTLKVHKLIERFQNGDSIAADDPLLQEIHATVQIHQEAITTAIGITAGKKPTCTARRLLAACGWQLQEVGRVKSRGAQRDMYLYKAGRIGVPDGIDYAALVEQFKKDLAAPSGGGAKTFPIHRCIGSKKAPTAEAIPHASPPLPSVGCSLSLSAPPHRRQHVAMGFG